MSSILQSESVRVEVTSPFDPFEHMAADWDRLAGGVPFRQLDWYRSWWKHFGHRHTPLILKVTQEDACLGIVPLHLQSIPPLGRIVRNMGSGDVCSDHQSLLCLPEDAEVVGAAVADWMIDGGGSRRSDQRVVASTQNEAAVDWNLVDLDGFDPDDPASAAMSARLAKHDFVVHCRSSVQTWRIDLPESMEAYLAILSKPCRRKVRLALNRFANGECRARFVESDTEFLQSWDILVDLHQRRRNSLGDKGCFACKPFTDFLFDAAKTFHNAGKLDFVTITIEDQPIASELCFRGQGTTFAYQLGIEPTALKENPGWLVNTASIARAIQMGQTGFDLCRGDSVYKHHLGARPSECRSLRLVPPRLRSQAWDAAWCTGSALKRWCRSNFSLTADE